MAHSFQPVLDALPTGAVIVLGTMVVVGAVLWLLGGSLVRLACVISGLVLGGLAGLMAGHAFAEQGAFTLPLVLGGGLAGALLAGLLFRVWMGISGAVLLAMVAPAASIIWTGVTPPPIDLAGAQEQVEEAADLDESVQEHGPVKAVMATVRGIYESQAQGVLAWWDELGQAGRGVLIAAALVGAVAGLLLGLIVPNIAASAESALVGAVLMFYPGRELLARLAADQTGWLPSTPRATLVTLGLITLLGVLIQWTLLRRRADK